MAQNSCKEAEEAPPLCVNNCGFFANLMCENMCSKCYKDTVKQATISTVVEKKKAAVRSSSTTAPLVADITNRGSAPLTGGKQAVVDVVEKKQTVVDVVEKKKTVVVDVVEKKKAAVAPSSTTAPLADITCRVSAPVTGEKQAMVDEAAAAAAASKPPSNRCFLCRKKVGLTGIKCKCGDIFCGKHHHSESHECTINYKQAGKEQIAEQNPVVKADKITRI